MGTGGEAAQPPAEYGGVFEVSVPAACRQLDADELGGPSFGAAQRRARLAATAASSVTPAPLS